MTNDERPMTNRYSLLRGAEPFAFQGNSIGCLLIHGFTGSPWEMRWLGEQLAADGHTVLGVRLAGHGTCPEAMHETRWRDWYASVVEGYRQLRAQCAHVVAIGLSLGGALALHLSAHEAVDALVVMATPLHIRDWRISLFRPFQRFIPYWRMSSATPPDGEIRDASIGYDRMPTICLVSMLDFFRQVERELPRVTTPTLFIYSQLDVIATPSEMRFIHDRVAAADKRMVTLTRSGHVVCNDVERELVLAEVREFIAVRMTFVQPVRP